MERTLSRKNSLVKKIIGFFQTITNLKDCLGLTIPTTNKMVIAYIFFDIKPVQYCNYNITL